MNKTKLKEAKKANAPTKEYRINKHRTYGHVYGEEIATPVGQACWVNLSEPKDPPPPKEGEEPGKPRYQVTILLKKEDKSVKAFHKSLSDMVVQMTSLYNVKRPTKISVDELLKDGDNFDLEKYPYYEDKWLLEVRNYQPIKVVAADNPRDEIAPSEIVGGVFVRAVVTPLLTAHGVSFKGRMVQFIEDTGERLAGGTGSDNYASLLEACAPSSNGSPKKSAADKKSDASSLLDSEDEEEQDEEEVLEEEDTEDEDDIDDDDSEEDDDEEEEAPVAKKAFSKSKEIRKASTSKPATKPKPEAKSSADEAFGDDDIESNDVVDLDMVAIDDL